MSRIFKTTLLAAAMIAAGAAGAATITLDGRNLTMENAWEIAQGKADVAIAPKAMKLLKDSHALVMAAAAKGQAVYGLTVGVGLNKDHKLFTADGKLTPEVVAASRAFNYNALRSHSAGVGEMMPKDLARLSMVIRLNTLLDGKSGAQARVAELYRDMLNKGVTPLIPSEGSIGEADILLASHVGAVMIGEWKAEVNGKVVSGKDALKAAGITPLVPEGKDALAILSNNSVAMAYAVEAARNAHRICDVTPTIYGLSLEGLNGNVAPILPQTIGARPFPGLAETAKEMRDAIKGSYLWQTDATRPLQDPLSYRVTVYGLSEAKNAVSDLEKVIKVQINSTDDNPATILNADDAYKAESTQVAKYFVEGNGVKGAIIPSGNFNPLPVALALQRTSLALAHLSHYSVQRTIHLSYDQFTGLTRFLSDPDNKGHAFGAIQKSFMGLHVDNMSFANPVSLFGMPVAGEIEDTFTNILQAAKRLEAIDQNLFQIYSVETLHSAQAIDLRRMLKNKDLKLSEKTDAFYKAYRVKVPYVKNDRIFTDDIKAGTELIKTYAF
ncbi:HAL/PAL/TAL family ammonia-lyase [Sutterella sp.]|uniref:HAL/PAL/TAL family ammonia-lyase n=1 Tax=Sutterella sp. TaxID=1981025 RepID=UPI003FD8B3B1